MKAGAMQVDVLPHFQWLHLSPIVSWRLRDESNLFFSWGSARGSWRVCTVKTSVQLKKNTLGAFFIQLQDVCLALYLYLLLTNAFLPKQNITNLKIWDNCTTLQILCWLKLLPLRLLFNHKTSGVIAWNWFHTSSGLTEQHSPLLPQSAQEMSSSGLLSRFCSLVPKQKLQMGMGSATGWQTAEQEGKGDTGEGRESWDCQST